MMEHIINRVIDRFNISCDKFTIFNYKTGILNKKYLYCFDFLRYNVKYDRLEKVEIYRINLDEHKKFGYILCDANTKNIITVYTEDMLYVFIKDKLLDNNYIKYNKILKWKKVKRYCKHIYHVNIIEDNDYYKKMNISEEDFINRSFSIGRNIIIGKYDNFERKYISLLHEIGHIIIENTESKSKLDIEKECWDIAFKLAKKFNRNITPQTKKWVKKQINTYKD